MAGPEQWERLSPYDLALFGYRVQGDAEETLIALYYPDPAAAATDSVELEKRWNSFYYDPRGPGKDRKEVPATLSCSPFSTTIIEGADHSVLVGACPVLRTEEWNVEVKGPSLWGCLFFTRELQFLVRDLKELKQVGIQQPTIKWLDLRKSVQTESADQPPRHGLMPVVFIRIRYTELRAVKYMVR